jgi:hypothetical protein
MKMESEVRELLTEEIKDAWLNLPGVRRRGEPCFERFHPCRQALHLRPQRPDQGI